MSHQNDNTIRLEARYDSASDEPSHLTLRCGLVTYRDAWQIAARVRGRAVA
jgi:hypothetical protein